MGQDEKFGTIQGYGFQDPELVFGADEVFGPVAALKVSPDWGFCDVRNITG